jgi:hypothetical protein
MTLAFGVLTPLSNTIHLRDQDGQEKFLGIRTLSDCPLWVKTGRSRNVRSSLLHLNKQTSVAVHGKSVQGHDRTSYRLAAKDGANSSPNGWDQNLMYEAGEPSKAWVGWIGHT